MQKELNGFFKGLQKTESSAKPMTGTLFLFTVPTTRDPSGTGVLHLFSFNDTVFTVLITLPAIEGFVSPHSETVTLSAVRVATYEIHHLYNALHLMEKQPCMKLTGDQDFGVYLVIIDGFRSAGSMQLLPVTAWGTHYFALTVQ
ncbi:hypothetical protein Btru_014787 [Bulinus truncatus]|nr:hypothetical protein Btru_014787 [Bulinus truncatus]